MHCIDCRTFVLQEKVKLGLSFYVNSAIGMSVMAQQG